MHWYYHSFKFKLSLTLQYKLELKNTMLSPANIISFKMMFLFCCGCRKTVLRLAPNSFISIPKSSFHNIHILSQAKSIHAEQQEKNPLFQ